MPASKTQSSSNRFWTLWKTGLIRRNPPLIQSAQRRHTPNRNSLESRYRRLGSDTNQAIVKGGGGYTPEVVLPPLNFDSIMNSDFWQFKVQFPEGFRHAATMLQPVGGIGHQMGILVGSYIFGGENSLDFAALSPGERIEFALSQGERLHPAYRDFMTHGISRAWSKVRYSLGSWANTDPPPEIHVPDGRFIFGGEHTTYLGGWQEGAVLSAHGALQQLATLVP